jgi:HSP20 family protein
MSITRYTPRRGQSPFRDFDEFAGRLGRLFPEAWTASPSHRGWMPAVNVEEKDAEILLTAELPGLTNDGIEVDLENNILTLRGEKLEIREEGDEGRYHLWERTYGSFQRSFTVPRTVQADNIDAHLDNGVLTVHLPKAPEAKSRKISIGKKA